VEYVAPTAGGASREQPAQQYPGRSQVELTRAR
jgi:hypothetical protein